jgi:serine protease Do
MMAAAANPNTLASSSVEKELARVAEQLRRITVRVRNGNGAGSGVIWHSGGLIITNAHVVAGPEPLVILADNRILQAHLVASDRRRDLASLQVQATGLAAAIVRDASSLRTGEIVLAVGNPMGSMGALAAGIVHSPPSAGWLQADIRLVPGHSGGPLADAQGRVIGINSMVANGLAFAVSSNTVEAFLKVGSPARLGVTVQSIHMYVSGALIAGLMVLELEPDSAAHLSGVMVGDVLIAAGGARFRGVGDLADAIAAASSAGSLSLEFIRAGRPGTCRVKFGRAVK